MPLILVTGLPSSGKSTLSRQLAESLKLKLKESNDTRRVKIVSDCDNLDWDGRDTIYMDITKEKELRGWLKAEVQRYINLNNIVVLDAAAYIKGFRYELFCISKEANTQYCVVEKLLGSEVCWQWNEVLRSDDKTLGAELDSPRRGYDRETFDALLMRYEKCDENNRWDSPLFRMTTEEDKLDIEELYRIVTTEQPLLPNKCTSLSSTTTSIFKPQS